ncbi:hypothetical protein EC968_002356 [Mortierella alpina]|nr:hypothetical protein EC968_002356 [Mortierella alpina]
MLEPTTLTQQSNPCINANTHVRDDGHPVYYNPETLTFYPLTPIRPITPTYLPIAQQQPVTLPKSRAILVILDLNGTLFYRTSGPARTIKPRPHLRQFLDFLFKNCRVMVWSSARPESVGAMLKAGFKGNGYSLDRLDRVWSRDHFKLDEIDYTRKVLTLKDLEYVWEEIEAERSAATEEQLKEGEIYGMHYDQTNTVLIDDSTDKSQLQPYNCLVLTDFDKELAEAGTDTELLKIKQYLARLIYEQNVSAYMRLHPFQSSSPEFNGTSLSGGKKVSGEKKVSDEKKGYQGSIPKSTKATKAARKLARKKAKRRSEKAAEEIALLNYKQRLPELESFSQLSISPTLSSLSSLSQLAISSQQPSSTKPAAPVEPPLLQSNQAKRQFVADSKHEAKTARRKAKRKSKAEKRAQALEGLSSPTATPSVDTLPPWRQHDMLATNSWAGWNSAPSPWPEGEMPPTEFWNLSGEEIEKDQDQDAQAQEVAASSIDDLIHNLEKHTL